MLVYTGAREQNIMKVRVRKKVSILLKEPEAPLFKYVNQKIQITPYHSKKNLKKF